MRVLQGIEYLLTHPAPTPEMRMNARKPAEQAYGPTGHYRRPMEVYAQAQRSMGGSRQTVLREVEGQP